MDIFAWMSNNYLVVIFQRLYLLLIEKIILFNFCIVSFILLFKYLFIFIF